MQWIDDTLGQGPLGKNRLIPDPPPPPPAVKGRKVGRVRDLLLTIDLNKARSVVVPNTFFNHHVGPPPPPPLKVERSGGPESLVDR
jgi:hypothetical protein